MLRRVALVRTDVLEELSVSIIRVTRMGELGTTLAVTSNRRRLYELQFLFYNAETSSYLSETHMRYCLSHSTLVRINEELLERKVAAPV
jgi:hypothetical protein